MSQPDPVSIILLVYNRPELTRQTLDTLLDTLGHTHIPHEVIVVDNASDAPTQSLLSSYRHQVNLIRLDQNRGIGAGKNIGISQARYPRFYISDNDLYYYPGWLDAIDATAKAFPEAKIIGAFRHPHHGCTFLRQRGSILFEQSDQQVGSSWFLTIDTWDDYGPLKEGESYGIDDVHFCNQVNHSGFWVGSISPHKVFHCGARNSDGELSPGGSQLLDAVPPKGMIVM